MQENRWSTFLAFCRPKILLILIVLLNNNSSNTLCSQYDKKKKHKKLYLAFHKEKEVPSFFNVNNKYQLVGI